MWLPTTVEVQISWQNICMYFFTFTCFMFTLWGMLEVINVQLLSIKVARVGQLKACLANSYFGRYFPCTLNRYNRIRVAKIDGLISSYCHLYEAI